MPAVFDDALALLKRNGHRPKVVYGVCSEGEMDEILFVGQDGKPYTAEVRIVFVRSSGKQKQLERVHVHADWN